MMLMLVDRLLDVEDQVAPGREPVFAGHHQAGVEWTELAACEIRQPRYVCSDAAERVDISGGDSVAELARASLVVCNRRAADASDWRFLATRFEPGLEVAPTGVTVLQGDDMLRVDQTDARPAADRRSEPLARVLIAASVCAQERLCLRAVPVEVEPVGQLMVHDEPPRVTRCPRARAETRRALRPKLSVVHADEKISFGGPVALRRAS